MSLHTLHGCIPVMVGLVILAGWRTRSRRRKDQIHDSHDAEICFPDEKPFIPQRLKVPGNSTAYYTGDPDHDILTIESFDALAETLDYKILKGKFSLKGRITGPLGKDPRIVLNVYINGRWAKDSDIPFCADGEYGRSKLSMVQNGKELPAGAIPTEGDILITTWNALPLWLCQKGWWSIRVEMNASSEVGARLTGFEGGVYVDGELDDGTGEFPVLGTELLPVDRFVEN